MGQAHTSLDFAEALPLALIIYLVRSRGMERVKNVGANAIVNDGK